jgi:ABC-2 type transport system permease protein
MSVTVVAKKEFRDAVRSRLLLVLIAVFTLFTLGGAVLVSQVGELFGLGEEVGMLGVILALQTPASVLVPLIALVVSYRSIAGERESGSVKYLLGLPHARRDVVLGKVLGRTGVVSVAILVGFGVGIVAIVALIGSFDPAAYLGFTLVTVLLGLVWVSIGVGASSMTRSPTRAGILGFGFLLLFWILWDFVGLALLYATDSLDTTGESIPEWYALFSAIPPGSAYGLVGSALLPSEAGFEAAGELSLFLSPAFGAFVLLFWIVVPLGIGLLVFERSDL